MRVAVLVIFGLVILITTLTWVATSCVDEEAFIKRHEVVIVNLLLVSVVGLCLAWLVSPLVGLCLLFICVGLDVLTCYLIWLDETPDDPGVTEETT